MSAEIRVIAQGVTELLNANAATLVATVFQGAGFKNEASVTFTAQRVYLPNYRIDKNDGLQVFVLGFGGRELDLKAGVRGSTFDTYTIHVAIVNQLDRDTQGQPLQTELDAMIDFVDSIIELLRTNKTIGDAMWNTIANKPAYDPRQLDENGTFSTAIEITYQDFSN